MGKKRKSSSSQYRRNKYYDKHMKRAKANAGSSRNFNSPEYSKWRDEVKKRDKHMCQWPGCCSRKRIQVHHIKTWAKYPSMRFVVSNGITLCRKCHDSVKGKEADYESFFFKLLEWQMLDRIKKYDKR